MLKSVYRIFADLENQSGDYEKANEMLMISIAYNDSLINEANIHAVADIQGKYEYERHQKEIMEGNLAITEKEKMIEKQRADITLWIGLALILFGIALIFLILYSNKQRKGMLLKGQLALLSQRKKRLEDMNNVISEQLDQTKISLEEKEELLNKLYESGSSKELPEELLQLSKREMEVLSYLALGWSDDQLAEKLFISKSTVKTHLRRIYSKLLVRGRAEAVAIAHKHNIIGEFL
jgi:ATP/maltotriose-dependent transcriptional regulator MalT